MRPTAVFFLLYIHAFLVIFYSTRAVCVAGDRPYQCMYCKETFRTSGHRESHQKRHLGEKDKVKTHSLPESEVTTIENNDCLDLSLSEEINLVDTNFMLPDISTSDFPVSISYFTSQVNKIGERYLFYLKKLNEIVPHLRSCDYRCSLLKFLSLYTDLVG